MMDTTGNAVPPRAGMVVPESPENIVIEPASSSISDYRNCP